MATLYGNKANFRTQKVLVAARYGGTKLNINESTPPHDKSPFGITPTLVEGKKALWSAEAIAYEVCGEKLHGETKGHIAEVIQWMNTAETEFLPAVLGWVLPSVSFVQMEKKAIDGSKAELGKLLGLLNGFLLSRTFLVGERLSVADISLAFNLLPAYEHVLEPSVRKEYVNVNRWFNTIFGQPEVKEIVGEVKMCEKPAQFDAKKFKEFQASSPAPAAEHQGGEQHKGKKEKKEKGGGKEKEHKEEKPKKEKESKKNEAEEEAEEMDATEEALAAEPKAKDPFETIPKTTFDFDAFKRCYSNEDTATKAIPYLWEKWDPENCSMWYCEYKFPKELTIVFMSCNLINGMFQRLEKMRKYSFGSQILFGTDNNSTISGVWFWRGQDLAFKLSEDWQIDYESYEWKKLDPKNPKDKKMIEEYLLWEGDFDGKKFNQGKIYK